jgi:hypothetical protein
MRPCNRYMNFIRRMNAGTARIAMTNICNQLIADFLQLGQRIFHKGKIVAQCSQDQIIDVSLFSWSLLFRFA